ncbi:RimK family protein [Reinekea blandensis]|uniref:ATP-grasp domain-containing protein n=1 Tax=Reinekea blandensis MED297 TaxID=314283 RepID=A4B9R4_9GAMM|nr:RimK family protein [Reinekea blandensis]EAR11365.1 hypothetical protein MED297_20797 [Reinekea sp. MED297] [Reinekea blandensis MED297]
MHKTLLVSDDTDFPPELSDNVISFATYLQDYPKRNEPKTRIINLGDTETYLSQGYYCSLLAEARQHPVMPSVKVINELRQGQERTGHRLEVSRYLASQDRASITPVFYVCFGQCDDPRAQKAASYIFRKFSAPLLKVTLEQDGLHAMASVERASLSALSGSERSRFMSALLEFAEKNWQLKADRKPMRWDLAILVNPQEQDPPSNRKALESFVKAARKLSINATLVTREDLTDLSRFDALFIRETTAIDHHTYKLAVKAESAGLVVIDDPQSILRCCNKVFLHDAFSYQNVPTPRTQILHELTADTVDQLEQAFDYPMVVKLPEGSFSRGVFKVTTGQELKERLQEMFDVSALVLVQEYMYTDYDWRIGVLNGRPLYACRYQMAQNHWQIYDHSVKGDGSGDSDTLPTFEVPKSVLDTALKACRLIGNGLYGVDVKVKNGKPYVLEVNDNPSIDHKVEDAYLGNELYMQIMGEFQQRLEARGRK